MTHSKKIFRNSLFSIANKLVVIVLGFLTRKAFIMYLSEELLGLNSLFGDLLGLLNLADMGLGIAVQFNLYKPIAEDDREKIGRILNAAKRIYNVVGLCMIAVGIVLSFFIQFLIRENPYPTDFLRIVFFLNILSSASSYFFVHKRLFLQASENLHLADTVDMVINLIMSVLRVLSLVLFRNYYVFVLLSVIQAFLSNAMVSVVCHKYYPYLNKVKGYTKDEIRPLFANIRQLIPNKISAYIYSNTDNTIISVALGLSGVTFYTNYNSISLQLFLLTAIIANVVRAAFGNALQEEHAKDRHIHFLKSYQQLQFFYAAFCSVSFVCVANDFVGMWYGEKFVASYAFIIVLAFDLFVHCMYQPLSMMLEVLGEFRALKWQEIFAMILNLSISVSLVFPFGVIGPVIGTLAVDLCTVCFRIYTVLYKHYREFLKDYLRQFLLYGVVFFAEFFGLFLLCAWIPLSASIFSFLLKGVICFVTTTVVNLLVFRKTEEFAFLKQRLLQLGKKEG